MSEFKSLDLHAPATVEDVLEGILRLRKFGEADILQLAVSGQLAKVFPIGTNDLSEGVADFVSEDDLDEASALPLSADDRIQLIRDSVPRSPGTKAAAASATSPPSSSKRKRLASFNRVPAKSKSK